MPQIHGQKRQIIEHIHGGERVVEFQTIEQPHAALVEADIAQVQIAVTAPHVARPRPRVEPRGMGVQGRLETGVEPGDIGLGKHVLSRKASALTRSTEAMLSAPCASVSTGRVGVKTRNLVGERIEMPRGQRAALRHRVEHHVLIEAPHLDHRIQKRAGAVEFGAACPVGDAPHAEIQLRRGAAVEAQLLFAGGQSLLGRGEIEIGQMQRALELEHTRAREEQMRDMRVDPLDGIPRPVGRRIRQKCLDRRLFVVRHACPLPVRCRHHHPVVSGRH